MEKINQKMTALIDALKSLHKSIELFYKYEHLFTQASTEDNRELLLSMRDSMIQRFEYMDITF